MLLRSPGHNLDQLQVFPLGGDALLIAWDHAEAVDATLVIEASGKPVGRQRAKIGVATIADKTRTVATFLVKGVEEGAALSVTHGTSVMKAVVPGASPDPEILVAALEDAEQGRLVSYVMGVVRGTFRLSEIPSFADFTRRLLQACGEKPRVQFQPRAHLAAGHLLYSAPPSPEVGTVEAIYSCIDQRTTELPFRPVLAASEAGNAQYVLVAPRWASSAGMLSVLIGDKGLAIAELLPPGNVPNVASLAEQRKLNNTDRHYVLRCLGAMGNEEARACARALQILAPAPIRELASPKHPIGAMLEFTASCGEAGVFVRGWIRDRNELVQDAEIVSPFGTESLKGIWHRLPRPDLQKLPGFAGDRSLRPGFVALAPIEEPVPVLQHGLRLITAGGAVSTTSPIRAMNDVEARNAVLSAVPPNELTPELLQKTIAPATMELHRRLMANQGRPEVVEIGPAKAKPAVSFIIPLYRNLSFLRLQTAAFAVDPEIGRDAELIYVLDSPDQRAELEHLLRGLHVVTGLSFRLVVMSSNFGYAAANNTGVRHARGTLVMLMNSDVIPLAANWLRSLRTALRLASHGGQQAAAVGPKLIFDDGSLQHAGLTFERDIDGRWYNTHFFKGYPRDWPEANKSRSVPGVTGAAMLMPRAIYEEVGGFSEDYVVGDYEDSDLCLKLRSRGYDIRYEPRAELYHFERRSITLHSGYVGTAASAYNRALHAQRWSALMEELTAGEELSDEEPVLLDLGNEVPANAVAGEDSTNVAAPPEAPIQELVTSDPSSETLIDTSESALLQALAAGRAR